MHQPTLPPTPLAPPRPAGRSRRRPGRLLAGAAGVPVAALLATALGATPAGAGAVPVDHAGPTWSGSVTRPTAEKEQSKLWRVGDAWWAVMLSQTSGKPTIHELRSNNTWRDTGTVVDTRAESTADVQFGAGMLSVISRTMTGDILYSRFSYAPGPRSYTRVAGFPVRVAAGGTESASLARDSTGKVWATWTQGGRVYLSRSAATTDTRWLPPRLVPFDDTTLSGDDTSAIVAFDGKIGVMWSDQQSDVFRFAWHPDAKPADVGWVTETPLPAQDGLADDHLSLKAIGGDKRVFAAVKTSFDTLDGVDPKSPQIYLLRRNANGTWTKAKAASVGDKLTRPQIALERTTGRIYFFATAPQAGGTIYYKSSPAAALRFARGRGAPILAAPGAVLNDVTMLKGSVAQATGLAVLAADSVGKRYYHSRLDLGTLDRQPPITQHTINSEVDGGAVTTSWPLATDDRFVVGYDIYRQKVGVGGRSKVDEIDATTVANQDRRTFSYTDSPGTGTWRYSIQARDAAGNLSDLESAASVTLPAP